MALCRYGGGPRLRFWSIEGAAPAGPLVELSLLIPGAHITLYKQAAQRGTDNIRCVFLDNIVLPSYYK